MRWRRPIIASAHKANDTSPLSPPMIAIARVKVPGPAAMKLAIQGIRTGPMPTPKSAITRRSEEHTSELQSLMRISYAVFCLKKKNKMKKNNDKMKHLDTNKEQTYLTHTDDKIKI